MSRVIEFTKKICKEVHESCNMQIGINVIMTCPLCKRQIHRSIYYNYDVVCECGWRWEKAIPLDKIKGGT